MVLVRRKKVVFKDVPDLSAIGSLNDATSVASGSSLPPPSANPAASTSTLDANGNEKSAKQLAREQDPDVFYIKQTGEIFLDYDKTLTLSSFSLDDFEASLHYNLSDPPHPLLVEINATLLNLIMKDTTGAKDAVGARPLASYGERQRLLDEEEDEDGEMEMERDPSTGRPLADVLLPPLGLQARDRLVPV